MRLCIPVKEKDGLSSRVAKKLSSAKAFAIVDVSNSGSVEDIRFIDNNMEKDEIIPFLASHGIDIFVVNEISKDDEDMILDMGIDLIKGAYGRLQRVIESL